MVNQSVACNTE